MQKTKFSQNAEISKKEKFLGDDKKVITGFLLNFTLAAEPPNQALLTLAAEPQKQTSFTLGSP